MRLRRGPVLGFFLILGGAQLLAFKQVTRVFQDPRILEQGAAVTGDTVADPTWVFFSAILIGAGLSLWLGSLTTARGWRRDLACAFLWISTSLLLFMHLALFVNGITFGTEQDLVAHFNASFLFHTGALYSFALVFTLFLLTLTFLGGIAASAAYLLAPQRFARGLADKKDWSKNEAHLVASSLLLVLGLCVFLLFLARIIARLETEPLNAPGFFASTLPIFYYLQIFFVGLMVLTVTARVFLVNWGTQLPWDRDRVRDSLQNVGRVERVLVVGAVLFNMLVLSAPAATDELGLSEDPVIKFNSRGLAWMFFLLAFLYVPYALSLQRLKRLLDTGPAFQTPPFSAQSLRIVLLVFTGFILLGTASNAADWSALGLMGSLAAWMGGVLLVSSVRVRLEHGLFEPSFRGAAGPALYFWSLLLILATAVMMWGAGNSYVATYQESTKALDVHDASPYGAELLIRFAAVALFTFGLLLSLALLRGGLGIRRNFLVPNIVTFTSLVVLAMTVFTIGVWATEQQLSHAYAGYAFHQYYLEEKIMVAVLIAALVGAIFLSVGRIMGSLVRARTYPVVIEAQPVEWTFRKAP